MSEFSYEDAFNREKLIIGEEKLNKLKGCNVALFGVGGVGGFVLEGLIRSGVQNITIIDNDSVDISNLNRQIISSFDNIGKDKVLVAKERALLINPNANITAVKSFYLPQNADSFDLTKFDYVIDAIDTITAKIELIVRCKNNNIPIISCMGTGGKLDPLKLKVGDIYSTTMCPLARVIRRELKERNIKNLKVIYSTEESTKREGDKKTSQPSVIFVPAVAGLLIAKEVILDLIKD